MMQLPRLSATMYQSKRSSVGRGTRNFVRQISGVRGTDVFRTHLSTLDSHLPFLEAQWTGGCRNGAELWRRLKGQGFQGSLRVVTANEPHGGGTLKKPAINNCRGSPPPGR